MRDPEGRLRLEGAVAIRTIEPGATSTAFLHHPLATRLAAEGRIVPFDWCGAEIVSPRYRFISQPTDWCDAQFHHAARHTLDIAETALSEGFELKDASAWNIVFDGCRPVFCDHLSFHPLASRQWWAFGQLCRHFVFPLALSRLRGWPARDTFLAHRDGIDAVRARALLGLRGRFSRLLPLLIRAGDSAAPPDAPTTGRLDPAGALHGRLIEYARRCLYAPRSAAGNWALYVVERSHYAANASQAKLAHVRLWIDHLKPDTVLDLGCNTGEFSRAALESGTRVISLDADHESIQQLYTASASSTRLHPVVANLADLHGGRGWNASEHPSLVDRLAGQADLLLVLALTHHLHFSEGIPLPEIAAFAASMTTAHLVLETLPPDDPMVVHLATQRRRDPRGFTLQRQLDAFALHFDLIERQRLADSGRELVLWKRRV
jgi:SAM-dependent methyltransferase